MRVGVYNRFWSTAGGAEIYGAAIAQVLAEQHEVDLLGHGEVDPAVLGERLRLDLSRVTWRPIRDQVGSVETASRDYDLLVNVSYLSREACGAAHGLYVVHFPDHPGHDLSFGQRLALRAFGPLVRRYAVVNVWGEGFYPREGRRPRTMWTRGEASFTTTARRDRPARIRFVFGDQRPPDAPAAEVEVSVAGRREASFVLDHRGGGRLRRRRRSLVVEVPADPARAEVEVRIVSPSFVPAELDGDSDDDRELGVPLQALHLGTGPVARFSALLGASFPLLFRPPPARRFWASYDRVLCNSSFTQGWVEKWWHAPSEVLHPPVTMHAGALDKDPIILAVGRFFDARAGHSKKQLEMVEAFRRLTGAGDGARGWSLHLVGGCSDIDVPYLDRVRAAAAGLPVEFHVNATGAELNGLYARASVFWHATGLNEDPRTHPERMEHFGISTVEAMSAGVVPVVLAQAGPLEIIDDGVSGHLFTTVEELVDKTASLLADPAGLARLRKGAEDRARHFALDEFAGRLRRHVDEVCEVAP